MVLGLKVRSSSELGLKKMETKREHLLTTTTIVP